MKVYITEDEMYPIYFFREEGQRYTREESYEVPEELVLEYRGVYSHFKALCKQVEAILELSSPAVEDESEGHYGGCICADCSGAELTATND